MLFSSIIFLYFFLPLTIFLYFFAPQKGRNFVLLIMSIIFYAWGEPIYVLLMIAQITASFLLVWLMDNFRENRAGRIFYILSVLLPFAALFYFKYFQLFYGNTVWHQNQNNSASNRDIILHLPDCQLLY